MFQTREYRTDERGFTLVELMVAVFLTAIAVISIYRGYTAFSQTADAQQQIMEMQQNLRIGITKMAADIRRAGMSEEDDDVAGFIDASKDTIEFSMDLGSGGVFASDGIDNDDDGVKDDDPDATVAALEQEEEGRIGDGDVDDDGERIRYSMVPNGSTNDLVREVWDSASADYVAQTIITNVEWLDFVYWDAGNPDATPPVAATIMDPTDEDPPGSGILWLTAGELASIDRVEITLVVRTTNEDYRYSNNETYENLQATQSFTVSPADNFRRRAFTMSVQIRNNI